MILGTQDNLPPETTLQSIYMKFDKYTYWLLFGQVT